MYRSLFRIRDDRSQDDATTLPPSDNISCTLFLKLTTPQSEWTILMNPQTLMMFIFCRNWKVVLFHVVYEISTGMRFCLTLVPMTLKFTGNRLYLFTFTLDRKMCKEQMSIKLKHRGKREITIMPMTMIKVEKVVVSNRGNIHCRRWEGYRRIHTRCSRR